MFGHWKKNNTDIRTVLSQHTRKHFLIAQEYTPWSCTRIRTLTLRSTLPPDNSRCWNQTSQGLLLKMKILRVEHLFDSEGPLLEFCWFTMVGSRNFLLHVRHRPKWYHRCSFWWIGNSDNRSAANSTMIVLISAFFCFAAKNYTRDDKGGQYIRVWPGSWSRRTSKV